MKGNDKTLKLHLAQFKKKLGGKLKLKLQVMEGKTDTTVIKDLFSSTLTEDDLINLYQKREITNGLQFTVKDYRCNVVLRFYLQGFPGCCGIQVIKWLYIPYEYRGKKLSYAVLDMAMALSKWFNFTVLTGTVSKEQPDMNFVLKKRKEWKMVKSFTSNRTGNKIHMWLTEIKY